MSRTADVQAQPKDGTRASADGPLLQRACACGQHTGGAPCTACAQANHGVRRRRLPASPSDATEDVVHDVLRSPGHPLDASARHFMETRFRHDFSSVRVHTGSDASASARTLGARAFTVGNHVVFGAGEYAPATQPGRHLLAHELTHVVQQGPGSDVRPTLRVGRQNDPAEREADTTADAVVYGRGEVPGRLTATNDSLQRACGPAAIGTRSECDDQGPVFVTGHPLFRFDVECDDLAAGEEARLRTTAAALPATGPIEIHGYASTDGDPTFNENLSCARAVTAQSVLTGAGIAAGRIVLIRHGPTPGPAPERRSVVVRATAPPTPGPPAQPLTVAFTRVRADTSPAGMPDRIPPNVDTTVGVGVVGFTAPMPAITLSIEGAGGGNGEATINGAATADVTSSTAVALRGTTQTTPGNGGNLRLVADQGPTRLATSNAFSVSAIPQNWSMTFVSLVTGPSRGIVVQDRWESDSGVVADLNETEISELVETRLSGGSQAGAGQVVSGFLPGDTFTTDTHSTPVVRSTGFSVKSQVSIFNDRRSGATNVPMTNSGYRIGRFILPVPGSGVLGLFPDFDITTMKFGSAETAQGVSSAAGRGSISRTQRM